MCRKPFVDLLKSFLSEDLFQNHCVLYRLDKTGKCLLNSAYGNQTDKCIVSFFIQETLGLVMNYFFYYF